MAISLIELGDQIRAARADRSLSQQQLADALSPPTNRSVIAHLEQGRRSPSPDVLERLCVYLAVPDKYWRPFTSQEYLVRLEFEQALSELTGRAVTLRFHDEFSTEVAQNAIIALFSDPRPPDQAFDSINSILVFYDVRQFTRPFFDRFITADGLRSTRSLLDAVTAYQAIAIRLFSTFTEAFEALNSGVDLNQMLSVLEPNDIDRYRNRSAWSDIEQIAEERLPDLGYISHQKAKQEATERSLLASFLRELASNIDKQGKGAISEYSERKRRQMGSLLRKFQSRLEHDLMSPLFSPDSDAIRREADSIAPKAASDLSRIGVTQAQAQRNLARYLSADHLDAYVATSMRTEADYVSVNRFVTRLFAHDDVRGLNLRYFNPTQSWIENRVAKGLVEALMLRRADLAIYLAQKVDSFGKDSEASVALGQGKPVIVYVPKLFIEDADIDTEQLGRVGKQRLQELVAQEGDTDDKEADETMDEQSLLGRLLTIRIGQIDPRRLPQVVEEHWADFDLYGEDQRIQHPDERAEFRGWLDSVVVEKRQTIPPARVINHLSGILVATAIRFEGRAQLFRAQHPLALQVILSSGVLNGILVARSVESCAHLVSALIRNQLSLELKTDDHNYYLVETTTGSTVRVISRHALISSAFTAFYSRDRRTRRASDGS